MTPSVNAEKLLKQFEGCKLVAYQDQAAVWTIGYGHTSGVTEGAKITGETAGLLLLEDLDRHAAVVNETVSVSINQNQFDALCSFVFNVGGGAFRASTMLKLINGGNAVAAALEFPKWDRAAGQVSAGLLRRRLAEKALFEKEVA